MRTILQFKNNFRVFIACFALLGIMQSGVAQTTTLGRQNFEVTPATPTMTFTTANTGTISGDTGYTTGTSGSVSTAAPSGANLFSEGSRGYRFNPNGGALASQALTFSSINTTGYSNITLSLRVAGMSIGSSGNGMENTIDEVLISVSPDNGTTWYQQAKVNVSGTGANARWAFTGTGSGSRDYAANNTFSAFSSVNNTSGGATLSGAAAVTTATITNLPAVANLRVRVTMQSNAANESWIIDDLIITGSAPTNSSASDIVTLPVSTQNIAYANYQAASGLTTSNSIAVGTFDIRDGGSDANDSDTAATTLNAISFTVTNPGILRTLAIFDGATNVGEINTVTGTATFTGLSLVAADDITKPFTLRATFKSVVTDNEQFSFTVNSATAASAGSVFAAANAGGAATSTTGDNNRIEVTATKLVFVSTPSNVQINTAMTPAVTVIANDANSNIDLDFNGLVSLTTTGTFAAGATKNIFASAGTASFSNLIFSAIATGITINASATGVTATGNSVAFDVTNPQPKFTLSQGATLIPNNGTFDFGNTPVGTSTSMLTFTITNTGTANLLLYSINGQLVTANYGTISTNDLAPNTSVVFSASMPVQTLGLNSGSLITFTTNEADSPFVVNFTSNGIASANANIIAYNNYETSSNIAYGDFQAASGLTTSNSVGVAGFTIQDGGGATDADNLPTRLTGITFNVSGAAASKIRTAALFANGVSLGEVAVDGHNFIVFNGLNFATPDNEVRYLDLRVTLLSTVTDNTQFAFTVSSATASATGSGFTSANAGGATSVTTGDVNRIEVTATKLIYTQQPTNALVGANIAPAVTVAAVDGNNNTDLDFNGAVAITSVAPLATAQNHAAVNGIATFSTISFTAAGTGYTLGANTTGLAGATSTTFDVIVQEAGELLMEDNVTYSGNIYPTHFTIGVNAPGTTPIQAGAPGLSYNGYGSTGIGNAITMSNAGEDVGKDIAPDFTSGSTFYISFLVNVTTPRTGDYFFSVNPTGGTTTLKGRVYVKASSINGFVNFGVANASSAPGAVEYGTANYAVGTTHVVVLKFNFTTNGTETATLFVNPDLYAEPGTPEVSVSNPSTLANVGFYTLRQGASGSASNLIIDGIRVATNWGALLGNPQYDANATIKAGNYNSVSVFAGTLTSGSTPTVPVTVNNAITVADGADFLIPNNTNLIQKGTVNSNEGAITVKRDAEMRRLDYVYWSSPVAGQNLRDFSEGTLANRFYQYIESTNAFSAVDPFTTEFDGAKGFMIRSPNAFPANNTTTAIFNGSFNGVPNNGNITIDVTNNGSGMNMIGNPYPSTISAADFMAANPSLTTLYFWTHSAVGATTNGANYATYNASGTAAPSGGTPPSATPNGTIQVGQGFIAATNANATINFTNAMRVNNTDGQFFRGVTNEKNRIWLNLSSETTPLNQILTGYITDATNDFDGQFDAKLIDLNGSRLYNIVNNSEFVIQGRALPFTADDVVALGFKAATAGNYTISLDHVDGLFSEGQDIFIKDNLTGATHDINEGAYTFASEAGTFNSRFAIVYQTTLNVKDPIADANSIIVFKQNGALNINSGAVDMQQVKIYDIRGRLLFERNNINAATTVVSSLNAGSQVLLVQVTADNKTVTKKVLY